MYQIVAQGDNREAYVMNAVVDETSDIASLPTNWSPGSRCQVINGNEEYILNLKKQWVKIGSGGSSSSSGGSGSGSAGGGDVCSCVAAAIQEAVNESKLYTDEKLKDLGQETPFTVEIVKTLPISDVKEDAIYFVAYDGAEGFTQYYEYVYRNSEWVKVGGYETDLSPYWTIDEVKDYVDSLVITPTIATTAAPGIVQPDGVSILIDDVGIIEVSTDFINDNIDVIEPGDIGNLFP